MASEVSPQGVVITHPNRDKPVVQATRAVVVALLLVSVVMLLVVSIGGAEALETSVLPVQFLYVVAYLLIAYMALRWSRGVLPVASALAVLLAIFALVGGSSWFERNHGYFSASTLNPSLLGVITYAIIPVQILLIVFAMRGFGQGWNVELERPARAVGHGAAGHSTA